MPPYGAFAPGADSIQLNDWMQQYGDSSFYDDFFYGTQVVASFQEVWNLILNGGNGSFPASLNNIAGHPGILLLNTVLGPPATNKVGLTYNRPFTPDQALANAYWSATWLVQLQQLSGGGDTFQYRVGLGDDTGGAVEHNNGVYLQHDATSANWLLKTAAGGVRTSVDSGVAVAATAWLYLGVRMAPGSAKATYSVNGVDIGTVSTNIPVNPVAPSGQLFKQTGNADIQVWHDAVYFAFAFNAVR